MWRRGWRRAKDCAFYAFVLAWISSGCLRGTAATLLLAFYRNSPGQNELLLSIHATGQNHLSYLLRCFSTYPLLIPLAQQLTHERIRKYSGFEVAPGTIYILSGEDYTVEDRGITGDAPKDFIRVRPSGVAGHGASGDMWPAYIAKLGHKCYPSESVTEHLLTRIGQSLGLNMAESSLMETDGKIRFLSRYFLDNEQILVHGADIFDKYLTKQEKRANATKRSADNGDRVTFQFVCKTIRSGYPDQADDILRAYVRMLAFDAIVGNNDRHHYNWGVVVHKNDRHEPYFSPIYDSARALFWNHAEKELQTIKQDRDPKRLPNFLNRYIRKSQPRTNWRDAGNLDHFDLIRRIRQNCPDLFPAPVNLCPPQFVQKARAILNGEFALLMSALRREMILNCLEQRMERLSNSLQIQITP